MTEDFSMRRTRFTESQIAFATVVYLGMDRRCPGVISWNGEGRRGPYIFQIALKF
jgi:hypothetical protein